MKRIFILSALVWLAFGCTRVTVVRVPDPGDSSTEGFRFYRPYPYLAISETAEEKSGRPMLQYKIIWLPDLSQEYAIQVRAGVGTVDFKPSFEEGWKLVGIDAKLDSKTDKIIEAASGFLEKGAKLFTGTKAAAQPLQPGIYRFIYDRRPRLPDGTPNPHHGKITGVDFESPVALFSKP